MTMKVSKGLEFPVVAQAGVGHMPAKCEDEQEAARVFYVAAKRATQRLLIGVGGDVGLGRGWVCPRCNPDNVSLLFSSGKMSEKKGMGKDDFVKNKDALLGLLKSKKLEPYIRHIRFPPVQKFGR
jgi:hypothetical protein